MVKLTLNNMLKIKHLSKHFGGIKAVNDCSFEIEKGNITALIGPNGSGKSTVFNCISGIAKPDRGTIQFDDIDIVGLSVDTISNLGISRVFQKSHLFENLTVKENLLLALDADDQQFWKNVYKGNKIKKEQGERVSEILTKMEINFIQHTRTRDLSFGQKRLVELARTILNPHKLLILDEPVAGVNPKIKKFISHMLVELRKAGTTILLIEHDMSFTLGISDSIIVLDAGQVIATGKPDEIRQNKAVLDAYLGYK